MFPRPPPEPAGGQPEPAGGQPETGPRSARTRDGGQARLGPGAEQRPLRVVTGHRGGPAELLPGLVPPGPAWLAGRRAPRAGGLRTQGPDARSACPRSPARGPGRTPCPTATARFSSTTGDGIKWPSTTYSACDPLPVRRPHTTTAPRVAGGDLGLPLCRAPGDRRATWPASGPASPCRMSRRSQRCRSWSASSTGSPAGSVRAPTREACSSISATSPCASDLARHQPGQGPGRAASPRRTAPAASNPNPPWAA